MPGYPTSWDSFRQTVPNDAWKGETNPNGTLSRFAARYRAASQYTGSTFTDIGKETADTYSAMIGVGLAYSAFEAFVRAVTHERGRLPLSVKDLGTRSRTYEFVAADLAKDFRGRSYLASQLKKYTNPQLAARIEGCEQNSDNILPLAEGVRHLVFHGVIAPGTVGGSREVGFFERLRTAVLAGTDQAFTDWFSQTSA